MSIIDNWPVVRMNHVEANAIRALGDGRLGALCIPGFIAPEGCAEMVHNLAEAEWGAYRQVYPPIDRLGITQFEMRDGLEAKVEYFRMAPAEARNRQAVLGRHDPLGAVLKALAGVWSGSADVAREPDGTEYFAGLVRRISGTLLHCDWAGIDAPHWAIGAATAQLTWNIYLRMPYEGGSVTVYDRPWDESAEDYHLPDSYGYRPGVVGGCRSVTISPAAGDLVFFNSKNFHQVNLGSGGERLSVSSFVGFMPDGSLALWS